MAKFSFTQNSLRSGEISKSSWGESDQEHYTNGCEKLKNVLLSKSGVQRKRLGSINVAPIYNLGYPENSKPQYSKYARLFPFNFQSPGGVAKSYVVIVEPRELTWAWDSVDFEYKATVNPEFYENDFYDSRYGLKILDVATNSFVSLGVSDVKSWLSGEPARAWSGFSLAELRNANFLQIENNLLLYSPNSIPCVINVSHFSGAAELLTWWTAVSIRAIPVDKIDYTFASGSTLPDKIKEGAGVSFYWLAQVYRDLYNGKTITFTSTTVGAGKAFSTSSSINLLAGDFIKVVGATTGYAVVQTYSAGSKTGTAKILAAIPASANPFLIGILGYSNESAYEGRGGSDGGASEFIYQLSSMVFFENRLVLGMGGLIAGSQIQSYGEFDFNGEASNDRPFVFRLLNSRPSFINWMVSGKALKIGTSENELLTQNPDSSLSMGLANISVSPETYNGSANRKPLEVSGNVIFVDRDRKTPLIQYFNRDQSSFRIANLIERAEDIFKRSYEQGRSLDFDSSAIPERLFYTRDSYVKFLLKSYSASPEIYDMTFQSSSDTMWVLDTFGCLYSASIKGTLASWSHHVLGGTRGDGEKPFVVSICSLPDPIFGSDSLFMLVERKINGSMLVTLEKIIDSSGSPESYPSLPLASEYPAEDDEAVNGGPWGDWWLYAAYYLHPYLNQTNILYASAYMDSAVFLGSDAPTDTFGKLNWASAGSLSHLAHLEGETVQAFSEGFYIGDYVVTDGEITLPQNYPWVVVGLGYEAEIIPVPPQFGALDGNSEGHIRRVHDATVRFHRTLDASIGPANEGVLPEEINFRPADLDTGEPTPFFNGLKKVKGFGDYGLESSIRITSDKPYPMGVVCVNFKGQLNEG